MRVYMIGISAYKGGMKAKTVRIFETWEKLKEFLTMGPTEGYVYSYGNPPMKHLNCQIFEVDTDCNCTPPHKITKSVAQQLNFM